MQRTVFTNYLRDFFSIEKIKDASLNGMQVEGAGSFDSIVCAVDTSDAVIDFAIANNAQCIVVHHGLFWGKQLPLDGVLAARLRKLFAHGINLYAVHLPLDMHLTVGNNKAVMNAIEIPDVRQLFDYGGFAMGLIGTYAQPQPISSITTALETHFGTVKHSIIKHDSVSSVCVITGDAFSIIDDVLRSPAELFISGELTHAMYYPYQESGKSGIFIGHYASEKGGMQLFADHLRTAPSVSGTKILFYDNDTGL